MALVNYVPHISQEAAQIARLGARRLMSWPADSSMSEEEEEEWEEVDPKLLSTDAELKQGEEEGDEEHRAFDDPWSDSNATADGCSLRHLTLH